MRCQGSREIRGYRGFRRLVIGGGVGVGGSGQRPEAGRATTCPQIQSPLADRWDV